ncbi:MAG: hypothetical protein KME10_02630 [Plectolyngbya sp. WJT66-NPBG17]|jgi:hypothetical protein|nr:hypothetical protein [Plectolyngbya sp. WJT66-NPBG17]MBW4524079.1 hypothetical protein [Phormidium tanganyikae FI6-MK23]
MKFNRFWNVVVAQGSCNSEPKINHRCDAQGNWYYQIYNPQADKHNEFGTEQEVRMWLDQQHYR